MSINLDEAKECHEFHHGVCKLIIGKRGGMRLEITRFRRTGKTKLWKTRPTHFMIPVKYGFYGPSTYVTHENHEAWHTPEQCPAYKMQREFADTRLEEENTGKE